jgi:hypothetical protein
MNVHDQELVVEPELEARLRRTLTQVSATIGETVTPSAELVPANRTHGHRRWRRATAIGVGLAAVPLAAFAYVQFGPEYVDQLPTEDALQHGTAGSDEYWLVPSFHTDGCGEPMPGVELVSERLNPLGAEWDTFGVAYGEPVPASDEAIAPTDTPDVFKIEGCTRQDERSWLGDPSKADIGVSRLGPGDDADSDWALIAAVHPEVRAIQVTTPGNPAQTVSTVPRADRPDGPRYAVVSLPADATEAEVSLLDVDGAPVPGGTRSLSLGR